MKNILLVEPNYKNKYPPIGLMKISTYFKSIGDFVVFHKGLMPKASAEKFEKVYITTLFTFDFEMCISTIRYYAEIVGMQNVFVGGIAATIMPDHFRAAVPGIQLLERQLTSSNMLGYTDDINIDALALDYDILLDIDYDYPMADSYFIYTSRGCPRKCDFCAVKTLEPNFVECGGIFEQITRVDKEYGSKKNLLIMDNNILYSQRLEENIAVLENLGFGATNNKQKKTSKMPYYIKSLFTRIENGKDYTYLLRRIKNYFLNIKFSRMNKSDTEFIQVIIALIASKNDMALIEHLREQQESISTFFIRFEYHKITRYVDFNQGLDARLLTEKKASVLARLAIKPCRIAFDDLADASKYFHAIDIAVANGLHYFSNYLLYNYNDRPEDLWQRLFLNVSYCEKQIEKISLFSFPMKYASIKHTDRNYVGDFWCSKYLKSINVILNVTAGVVAKEKDFFLRAFGNTPDEFLEILAMPYDFIRFRKFFDENGLTALWLKLYRQLTTLQKEELLMLLSTTEKEVNITSNAHDLELNAILYFYTITKSKFSKDKIYYFRRLGQSASQTQT